jgi:L-fucose isomerase-like protein
MPFLFPTPTRLGLVCLARLTFEAPLAEQWYAQTRAALGKLDGVELCAIDKLVIEAPDADAAIAELRAKNIDALVIVSGTFALGGLAMQLAQAFAQIPLMLWAWHEPKEQTGKLRLNSLVGANTNASNLYKLGHRPTTQYTAHDDPDAADNIARFARIAGILRDLRQLRIAFIGGHAPGFDDLAVDKLALRRATGVEIVDVGLQILVARAKAVAEDRAHAAAADLLKQFDDAVEISARQGDLFAALVIALTEFAADNKFDALTLKCWGDLVEAYGIAGCGVVSILNDRGIYTGCEGDIMGTITTLIAWRLTGIHPFLTDFVSVDRETNTGLMWHGGCAPVGLADSKQKKHLFSHFAGGKGVTAGFALKPGRVTLLRLGDDGRNLRMLATTATALDTEMQVRGTLSRVKFDCAGSAFLDEILSNGWEHHLVMAYGEIVPELEMLARALPVPITVVK